MAIDIMTGKEATNRPEIHASDPSKPGKKQAPAPPDYAGIEREQSASNERLAANQTRANRPNQTNAFGGKTEWTQDAAGNWSQVESFGGPLGDASTRLQGEIAGQGPMDWSQFGTVDDGSQARDQAIESSYNQSTKRLNPQWDQRETQMRSRLANQGLDPNSEAARGANQEFTSGRNDAYGSAMSDAVRQGATAGDSVFRNSMMRRQQAISEALRRRGQPGSELQMLQDLMRQRGFTGAQQANPSQALSAANMQGSADMERWRAQQQQEADAWGAGMQAAATFGPMAFSDERVKTDIRRFGVDILPGVPAASWTYREGFGPPGTQFGVIAQDLEAAGFERYVHVRKDGLKMVDYSFLEATDGP